jgi:hypothetical protein
MHNYSPAAPFGRVMSSAAEQTLPIDRDSRVGAHEGATGAAVTLRGITLGNHFGRVVSELIQIIGKPENILGTEGNT